MSLEIVVGGQFGSEAKGAVTAAISRRSALADRRTIVVRTGGPNAGHSAADPDGKIWALRQVPAGMVVHPEVEGVIASGSEIDVEVLDDEVTRLAAGGIDVRDRLYISSAATIITPEHKATEGHLIGAIGSTGKGIGAARADRIMRNAATADDVLTGYNVDKADELESDLNNSAVASNCTVVIEGTQGYGLGLHTRFYPQVTSGDCRAIDVCAQAGINPWGSVEPWVNLVIRPYPIRVAGNSGPLEGETTWEELGLPVELTTVTRKPRRVGLYDANLVQAAIRANGPNIELAVSMVDQIPGCVETGELTDKGKAYLHDLEDHHGTPVGWYGIGPLLGDWKQL